MSACGSPSSLVAEALSMTIAGPSENAEQWLQQHEIQFRDETLRREFDLPLYRLEGTIVEGEAIRVTPTLGCQLVPCCFHIRSVRFNCKRWREKLPGDAYVLALFASPPGSKQDALDFDHVYGAFAYARFYLRTNTAVIMEIQNDTFGQLTLRRDRQAMRHWHRLTLLCLHAILRRSMVLPLTLNMPASEYQLKRFPKLSPFLAERVYEQLPAEFGYESLLNLDQRIEPASSPKRIGRAWRTVLHADNLTPLETLFADRITIVEGNRYIAALDSRCLGQWRRAGNCLMNSVPVH